MLDVAWSPIHPALFAAVDGGGRLDLWNLNQDTEVPAAGVIVDGFPALNRVSWTPSGLHVTVGDNQGKIWVYDVAEVKIFSTIKKYSIIKTSFLNRTLHIPDMTNGISFCIQHRNCETIRWMKMWKS